jgi:Domain of unknown function (DUF4296)
MRKTYILFFLMLMYNCREKEQKYDLPIDQSKLKSLLIDLYIAGAASELNPEKNKDSIRAVYHTEICKTYNMDSKTLALIIERLHALPKINGEIQKQVLDTLNAMQSPGFKKNKDPNQNQLK